MINNFMPHLNRRRMITGAAGLAGATSLAGATANMAFAKSGEVTQSRGEVEWEVIKFGSPEEKFRHFMRMAYGLDEEPFVFWAMLTYTYFKPGTLPVPIFGKEAMELSQAKQMRPNVWQVQGNNLSFPLDIETGEYITEFQNPISGHIVPLPDAKVANDDPGLIVTPQGNRAIGKLDMQPMSASLRSRPNALNSTRSRISGSSCARTGYPIGFLPPTTISWTTAARRGTSSSINLGAL